MSEENQAERPEQKPGQREDAEQIEQSPDQRETEDTVEFETVVRWAEFLSSPDFDQYSYEQRVRFFKEKVSQGQLEIDLEKLKQGST